MDCTIGFLCDGLNNPLCFTLEPALKDGKGPIPNGVYKIAMTWSPRFDKMMPEVLNVPGFEGIRIHPGNTDADTEGCILLGTTAELHRIDDSQIGYDNFIAMIKDVSVLSLTVQKCQA